MVSFLKQREAALDSLCTPPVPLLKDSGSSKSLLSRYSGPLGIKNSANEPTRAEKKYDRYLSDKFYFSDTFSPKPHGN
jgi:hypothetical protein